MQYFKLVVEWIHRQTDSRLIRTRNENREAANGMKIAQNGVDSADGGAAKAAKSVYRA